MSKYRFNCNGNSTDITYSSDNDVEGTLNGVTSGVFDVYAIDSRNNSTLVTKNANSVIDYTPIVKGNISVARTNGVSESVTLKIDGKADLVDFGVVTNEIKQSKYRYRATDAPEWSDYNDLTLTVDEDGNFTFNDLISGDTEELGFNINNSYQVEILVADELSQVVYTATLGSGTPNLALSKNGVGIMGKYDEEVGGLLQVGGKKIEDLFSGRVLYDNSNGSNGSITVNETSENFECFEIFFHDDHYHYNSVKVYSPNGKEVCLFGVYHASGHTNLKSTIVKIQNNSITPISYTDAIIATPSITSDTNFIYITRVVAYSNKPINYVNGDEVSY